MAETFNSEIHTIASSLSPALTSPGIKDRTKSLYRTDLLLEENFPTTFLASSLARGKPFRTKGKIPVRSTTLLAKSGHTIKELSRIR